MVAAPALPRAIAFRDGQNLFHTSREAFGYVYPNYDAAAPADAVCRAKLGLRAGTILHRSARRGGQCVLESFLVGKASGDVAGRNMGLLAVSAVPQQHGAVAVWAIAHLPRR